MAEKLYYSMGEVTEMFDVEPSLIRYWCSQFTCLRPKRNAKGNRMFTPQDIERLKRIHHLLKDKKMTIEGAKKAMRKRNIEAEEKDSDIALLEQLQALRAMLVEMRETIGEGEFVEDVVDEAELTATEKQTAVVEEPVVVAEPEPVVVAEETVTEETVVVEESIADDTVVVAEEPAAVAEPTPKKKRAPRRKLIGEEGVIERPLFPFYEQTLF